MNCMMQNDSYRKTYSRGILAAITAVLTAFVLLAAPGQAHAATVIDSGICGLGVTWTLDDEGLLTIEGSGRMANCNTNDAPWAAHSSVITALSIGDGVTSIGARAFQDCTLLSSASLGSGTSSIGTKAFQGCSELEELFLPQALDAVQPLAFDGCNLISNVYYTGAEKDKGSIAFSNGNNSLLNACWHYKQSQAHLCSMNLIAVPANDPICEEPGNSQYYRCSICDKLFSDESGKLPLENISLISIPALGHDWGSWEALDDCQHARICTRDATHVEKASHCFDAASVCVDCGYTDSSDYINPSNYQMIEGSDSLWAKNSIEGIAFASNAPFSKFQEVRIDGEVIGPENYDAWRGSTWVKFDPAFLKDLPAGKHTLTIASTDGDVSCSFAIGDVNTFKGASILATASAYGKSPYIDTENDESSSADNSTSGDTSSDNANSSESSSTSSRRSTIPNTGDVEDLALGAALLLTASTAVAAATGLRRNARI